MNKYEILENMFLQENEDYVVDGKAIYDYIEGELEGYIAGDYYVKDKLCFDNKTYIEVKYEVEVVVTEEYKIIKVNRVLF